MTIKYIINKTHEKNLIIFLCFFFTIIPFASRLVLQKLTAPVLPALPVVYYIPLFIFRKVKFIDGVRLLFQQVMKLFIGTSIFQKMRLRLILSKIAVFTLTEF